MFAIGGASRGMAGQREARRAGLWSGEARADMAIHSLYADAESDSDDDALLGVVFGHSARATASLDAHAGMRAGRRVDERQ